MEHGKHMFMSNSITIPVINTELEISIFFTGLDQELVDISMMLCCNMSFTSLRIF